MKNVCCFIFSIGLMPYTMMSMQIELLQKRELTYEEKVDALRNPNLSPEEKASLMKKQSSTADEFLINNLYLRSMKDPVNEISPNNKIEAAALMQSRKVVDFLYAYKDSIKDQKINDQVPFIQVDCFTENIPSLIRILRKNWELIKEKDQFNIKDLTFWLLRQTIDVANALDELDLQPVSIYKDTTQYPFVDKSMMQVFEDDLVEKIERIKPEMLKALESLNPNIAKKIAEALVKKEGIDKYLLEPYSKKLYTQKTKIILPYFSEIYYYQDDLIFYSDQKNFWMKQGNKNPIFIEDISQDIYYAPYDRTVYVSKDKTFFIYFDQDVLSNVELNAGTIVYGKVGQQKKEFVRIPGEFTACSFVSNNLLYLGDKNGKLYWFDCNEKVSNSNPQMIEAWSSLNNDGPIRGIVTSKNYNNVIIYTDKRLFLCTNFASKLQIFEEIQSKFRGLTTLYFVTISPSGRFIASSGWPYNQLLIYDRIIGNVVEYFNVNISNRISENVTTEVKKIRFQLPLWIDNVDYLFIPNQYLFINPYSGHSWTLKSILYKNAISADGMQVIANNTSGWFYSNNILETLVDNNMRETLQFIGLNPQSANNQLIGIALLHQLIQINSHKAPEDSELLDIYNNYVPEAVRNVWELKVPVIPEVSFESQNSMFPYFDWRAKLNSIKETLNTYKYQIFGVTGLGLAAAYIYWKSKQAGSE